MAWKIDPVEVKSKFSGYFNHFLSVATGLSALNKLEFSEKKWKIPAKTWFLTDETIKQFIIL
jgi:hypothetical protein